MGPPLQQTVYNSVYLLSTVIYCLFQKLISYASYCMIVPHTDLYYNFL